MSHTAPTSLLVLDGGPLCYDVFAWRQGDVFVPGLGGARLAIGRQVLELRPLEQMAMLCGEGEERLLRQKTMAVALAQDTREQLERMRALREDLPAGQHVPLPPCLAELPEVSPWLYLLQATKALWGPDCEGGVALFGRVYPLLPGARSAASSGLELQAGTRYHSPERRPHGRRRFAQAYGEAITRASHGRLHELREHVLRHVNPVLDACSRSGEPLYRDDEWTLSLGPEGSLRLRLDFGRFCLQHSSSQWYMAPGPLGGELSLSGQGVEELLMGRLSVEGLLGGALRVHPHYRHPYVSDGAVCFGGRQRIVREAIRREGVVRESRLLIAALRATSHLIRRGIVDTGEGLSPFRSLPDSEFIAVSWATVQQSGLPHYEFRRQRFHSI